MPVTMPITLNVGESTLTMDATVVYCEAVNPDLCYFSNYRFEVPLKVSEGRRQRRSRSTTIELRNRRGVRLATKGRRVAALLLGISIIAWIVVLGVVLWEASRNAEVGVLPTAPPTVVTQIALVATATTAPTITASIEPTDLPTTAPSSTVTNTAIPGAARRLPFRSG
ncbi:MAG: hypothetical protein U0528_05150 [Anaerolineae bacterium]